MYKRQHITRMRISYQYKIRKRVISGGELLPYLNLKTELKKTNITNEEIAHVLRLRTEDVLDKLEGSGRFLSLIHIYFGCLFI